MRIHASAPLAVLLLSVTMLVTPAAAQPAHQDESWPCIQRKVPQLQPAQVLKGPPV